MEGCWNHHLQPPPSLAWERMSLQMPCVSSDIQTEDQVRGAKTSCPYSPLFQFLSHRNFRQEKFVLCHKLEEYFVLTIDKKRVVVVKVTKGDS